ncbi:hormogonium polysaccharide biosynthesis glycosyltransferase HpsE [Iningainema tapete]|uniref:Glycosyltransferase family 2 protein n=1 Tax=Iningainema tapete BLCC-T55 TaxID=2748662 RepID=A0A8J6XB94_9CYAN|nr:hormogonium polysaccharide biosynthesis glycosyltransferase HpsE [Iningainema tapete]MBD2771459.1 glycosyltransferase family 2 protein [Iningainema tapete BLCC-T55]
MDNTFLDFTIAIPTFNGENRLPKLLERLRAQIGVEHLKWEIIIVDNNSTDKTAEVVRNYQTSFDNDCPLRYFLETEQGAAFARLRAVREAKGELIGFLDDDNLPTLDWVKEAVLFGKEYPQAGAWGGQIHGDYEIKPPDNFTRIQSLFAIRERGEKPNLYDPDNLSLPPGAALVIRKQAWCESVPQKFILKGRLGQIMVGGEDLEPLLYIHKAGWQIWYNPTMHTFHQIPKWRLEKDYLITLARGCGLSICQLRLLTVEHWRKPIVFVRTFVGNLRRVLQHFIKYRGQLQSDAIAMSEMEFYLSSMMSPFYVLKRSLRREGRRQRAEGRSKK